jgi:hypothetical protein
MDFEQFNCNKISLEKSQSKCNRDPRLHLDSKDYRSVMPLKFSITDYFDDSYHHNANGYRKSKGIQSKNIDRSSDLRNSNNTRSSCKTILPPFNVWSKPSPCQTDTNFDFRNSGVNDRQKITCTDVREKSYERTFDIFDYLPCGTPKMVIEDTKDEYLGIDTRYDN